MQRYQHQDTASDFRNRYRPQTHMLERLVVL